MWVQSLGQEDALEERMATHSNIFAWGIPWAEEPGGLLITDHVHDANCLAVSHCAQGLLNPW